MPPSIAKFLTDADTIQRFASPAAQPAAVGQSDRSPTKPAHSTLIVLPFVFSHTTFSPLKRLSITQYGKFLTRNRKGKFQTFVAVDGHVHQTFTGEQPS